MKLMIASDVHGSAKRCREMLDRFDEEEAGRLVLLGDLLYHGPRNDLPEEYDPKAVAQMLNGVKERLLCVRGNCDAEVDQMVLEFPMLAEYAVIAAKNRLVYLTHGHRANEQSPMPLGEGDILLCGHTHIPKLAVHEKFVYMNPGSVTMEKPGASLSYMTYSNGLFEWKRLGDAVAYDSYAV